MVRLNKSADSRKQIAVTMMNPFDDAPIDDVPGTTGPSKHQKACSPQHQLPESLLSDHLLPWQQVLSDYLDGTLTGPERAAEKTAFEEALKQLPELRDAYCHLRSLREKMQETHLTDLPAPDLWSGIQQALIADLDATHQQPEPIVISDELLSAYLDGEITPAECEQLEAQLLLSGSLNQRLATFQQLSGMLRRANLHLEETVFQITDVSESVLRRFADETAKMQQTEALSAYFDQALDPKEAMALSQAIEASSELKQTLQGFQQLSDLLKEHQNRLEEALEEKTLAEGAPEETFVIPDLWPAISQVLSSDKTTEIKTVLPFKRPAAFSRVAASLSIAASFTLLFMIGLGQHLPTGTSGGGMQIASVLSKQAQPATDFANNTQELAAIPSSEEYLFAANHLASSAGTHHDTHYDVDVVPVMLGLEPAIPESETP